MRERPLAVMTGASSGFGFAFAPLLAARGFDLAADEAEIVGATTRIGAHDRRLSATERPR